MKIIFIPWLLLFLLIALSLVGSSADGIVGIWLHVIALIAFLLVYRNILYCSDNVVALTANISFLLSACAWGLWIMIITANYAI